MEQLNFVTPRNVFIIGGQKWEDDSIDSIDYTASQNANGSTLDPGETLTAVEAISNKNRESLALRAIATTVHPHDFDNDNNEENAVRYRYQVKPDRSEDKYHKLPGLSSTLPFGQMANAEEFIPGAYIGPVAAFRLLITNRTSGTANPTNIDVDEIGAHLHGRVLRDVDADELVQPVMEKGGR